MTGFWTFTVDALNAADVPTTLRFSNKAFIDGDGHEYKIRLLQPSLINVSPNDGGVLTIFGQSSVGEVELANIDGALSYLADYAVDGRPAVLSWVDGATTTVYFTGTVGRMQGRGPSVFFALKAWTESLSTNHPLGNPYAGDNVLPAGLEGTAGDIEGKIKPRVYGPCSIISAVPVNTSLLIYQASSKPDCLITAVFDEGVRLTNYLINGAHSVGATSIAVDTGTGDIPAGAQVILGDQNIIYTVDTGLSAGVIVLATGLAAAVADNAAVEVVNFYTGTGSAATELQGATLATTWGSYQGYFRLSATPAGVVTCNAISVTDLVMHRAGDVMAILADEAGITIDSAGIAVFNAAGAVGIYVDNDIQSAELLNKVVRSVIGYYWFDAGILFFDLLRAPATTPDLILEDWMISDASPEATGIGSNGVPIHGCKMRYGRIETVQTTVAGGVDLATRERLKNQYLDVEDIDTPAQARHLLSEKIEIEGYLNDRADALTAATRLKNIGKTRRDIITALCNRAKLPAFSIGQTALVKKDRLGYGAGRKMMIVGAELDAKQGIIKLRLYG